MMKKKKMSLLLSSIFLSGCAGVSKLPLLHSESVEVHTPRSIHVQDRMVYLAWVLLFAFVTRFIMCLFKAFAIQRGEWDQYSKNGKKFSKEFAKYWTAFRKAFDGFATKHMNTDDLWLPSLVNAIELTLYPVLMKTDHWSFIGVWLGIKTASRWGIWQRSRAPYSRFLTGNLLVILFSYFVLRKLIYFG